VQNPQQKMLPQRLHHQKGDPIGCSQFSSIPHKLVLGSETRELTVDIVSKEIIKNTIESYTKACQKYEEWEKLKYLDVKLLWDNIKPEHVKTELIFLLSYCNKIKGSKREKNLASTIEQLVEIPEWWIRLNQLVEALEVFEFTVDSKFWAKKYLQNLKDDDLTLDKITEMFKNINFCLTRSKVTNNTWEVAREISTSRGFITFLRSLVGHDLKNLINGVDDHSDERLMQADTVSTFIQVKSILEPLLDKKSKDTSSHALNIFFPKFIEVTVNNPVLAGKIRLCNSNYQALKNMYDPHHKRPQGCKYELSRELMPSLINFRPIKHTDNIHVSRELFLRDTPIFLKFVQEAFFRNLLEKNSYLPRFRALNLCFDIRHISNPEFATQKPLANDLNLPR
ncbi:13785_t:CDS:2, partial [Acaulospora colombiana]